MSSSGWIKLHRSLKDKAFYNNPKYLAIWIEILLSANHKDNEFLFNNEIVKVPTGSCIMSQKKLSKKFGISLGSVNRILKHFENENQIGKQTTNKYTMITVINWGKWNPVETKMESTLKPSETKLKPSETNKKDKKEKKDKNVRKEPTVFYTTKKNKKLNGIKFEWFNNFWKTFNYKKGKAEAADSWLEINGLNEELYKTIISSAKNEAERRDDMIDKGKTPKMAQGWLTGKRWEDVFNDGYNIPDNWEHLPI